MKRAAAIVVGLLLGFLGMGIAFAAAASEVDIAAGTFQGAEKAGTPKCFTGEDSVPYETLTVTATGSSVQHSPAPGDFSLNSTAGGMVIKIANVVNLNTGQGTASGPFSSKMSATRRLFGTFNAVTQITNPTTGAAIGRGFVKAKVQKHVRNPRTGRLVWKNTPDGLWANTVFVSDGAGNFVGAFGYTGDGVAPFDGAGNTYNNQIAAPNFSVETTGLAAGTSFACP
jgi:hypothetical protein